MKKTLKNRGGFTLVELIVVIAILAVLAMIAIPSFSSILGSASDSADLSEARNVYLIAQMVVVDAEINGETPSFDLTEIATDAGLSSSDISSITYDVDDGITVTMASGAVYDADGGDVG